MKSKYFGEFLVEKSVITKEHLVDALIEQIATTPPLCQVIFQNHILPADKVFEAFRYQQDNQVEFMQACKSIGAWTQEVQDKTFGFLDDLRKPLGHILINKGHIDLKKLTHMLDEFLSQVSADIASPAAAVISAEPKPTAVPGPDLDAVEDFQPGILMELEETFDEKKKKMIRIALSLVKDNAGTDNAICSKLILDVFKIVHGLNGLLALLAVEQLSDFLSAMETYLNQVLNNVNGRSKEQLISDTEVLTKGIDLAWSLRMSILTNSTEKIFFKDSASSQQYSDLIQRYRG